MPCRSFDEDEYSKNQIHHRVTQLLCEAVGLMDDAGWDNFKTSDALKAWAAKHWADDAREKERIENERAKAEDRARTKKAADTERQRVLAGLTEYQRKILGL